MRTSSFIVAALLFCSASALAHVDKKQEMYDQAMKAGGAGRVEEAAKLLCDLAAVDANFKDSRTLCAMYTREADLERKRSDDRFTEGVKLFQEGRYDEAEQRFKNVRAGTHIDDAKQYIARIPAAKNEKQAAENENTKFDQGAAAYRANDFATAKSALAQVTGKRAQEAQIILDNIKRYETAITAGDAATASTDWSKAIAGYNAAAAIKPDGPGDPQGKLSKAQTQLAAVQKEQEQKAAAQKPPDTKMGAVKETKAVDINKLLREATAAQAQGNYAAAAGKYLAVLAAEPNNAVARRGFEYCSKQTSSEGKSAGSEADAMLARGIREYYMGLYDDSEVHIKDYLSINGSKTGLSNFYLGANELTRYYLAGERDTDKKLLADAKTYFQLAHGTAGFTPPGQNVISPKILKVYNGQ